MRKVSILLALCLALVAGVLSAGTAQATATCSASNMASFSQVGGPATMQVQPSVTCSGGTAASWQVVLSPQFLSGGVWTNFLTGSGQVLQASMPPGSCDSKSGWAWGGNHDLDADFSGISCIAGETANDAEKPLAANQTPCNGVSLRLLIFFYNSNGDLIKESIGNTDTC